MRYNLCTWCVQRHLVEILGDYENQAKQVQLIILDPTSDRSLKKLKNLKDFFIWSGSIGKYIMNGGCHCNPKQENCVCYTVMTPERLKKIEDSIAAYWKEQDERKLHKNEDENE